MKTLIGFWGAFFFTLFLHGAEAAPPLELHLRLGPQGLALEVPLGSAPLAGPAELRLEESFDLRHWHLRERAILPKGRTGPWNWPLESGPKHGFLRIRADLAVELLRAQAEETLGYGQVFADHLRRLGPISREEFARLYPDRAQYLPELTWDATTADYFAEFQSEPPLPPNLFTIAPRDFRLNETELGLFRTNGFDRTHLAHELRRSLLRRVRARSARVRDGRFGAACVVAFL